MARGAAAFRAGLLLLLGAGTGRAQDRPAVAIAAADGLECPAPDELRASLVRQRLSVAEGPAEGTAVRLDVRPDGEGLAVVLRDGADDMLLDRRLPRDDCAALADAVALLVESRLAGVRWRGNVPDAPPDEPVPAAPPPPVHAPSPAPARESEPLVLSTHLGVIAADPFEHVAAAPGPFVGLRASIAWLDVALSGGWLAHPELPAGPGSISADEVPIDLDGAFALRFRRVEVALGARLELGVLFASSADLDRTESRTATAVRAGPLGQVFVEPLRNLLVGLSGGVLVLASGYDLVIEGVGTTARQSRFVPHAAASLGYRF